MLGNGESFVCRDGVSIIVQSVAGLPALAGARKVYLDFETSSGNPKLDSLNPWHHCSVALIAIAVDDSPNAYAIPYMHFSEADKDIIQQWLGGILYSCDEWINQNVKYDAHVAANDLNLLPASVLLRGPDACKLVCSLTQAKMIDSDRITRGGYGLDSICKDWIGEDLSDYYQSLQPYIKKNGKWFNHDYGRIPFDILGAYACAQVLANRRLQDWIDANLPAQCHAVRDTEIELTQNIWQMERNGLRVDPLQLQTTQLHVLNRLVRIEDELAELVGEHFRPHVSDDLYDVLCVKFGMPILAYTKDKDTGEETTNPSFDKHALRMYEAQPNAPHAVLKLIFEYKKLYQLNSLFLSPWQDYALQGNDGFHYLNSTYNQAVRTGRMSGSEPNPQQLDENAKRLVHPRPGWGFLNVDYSQIEFRFIVHYIQDAKAIAEYNANPDADFHELVAQWCGIPRQPAKSVNFGIAFGEGKKKLIKQLASNKTLVASIIDHIKELIAAGKLDPAREISYFAELAEQRGLQVFNTYHATFPTLKQTMREAERALMRKGYVFNFRGRHRHLPLKAAYRAFNTINQSSAADMMKERFNALCRMLYDTPIEVIASVHDAFLLHGPVAELFDPRTVLDIVTLLENPPDKISVPIRVSCGCSIESWKGADSDSDNHAHPAKILLQNRTPEMFTNLAHLRTI